LSTCERKERGEILNEDGREIRWMKEIWKRRERIEKKGVRDRIKNYFFWELLFLCLDCCLFLNKNC
jgi:hypothetical protein